MAEEIVKDNDYTLSVIQTAQEELPSNYSNTIPTHKASLTRTFNFLSEQVTTITRDTVSSPMFNGSGGDAATAVTSQMIIQNFSDFDSTKEIELMREKLKEMGGTPPETTATLDKVRISAAIAGL